MGEYNPDVVFPPGETLKEMMEERGISLSEVEEITGMSETRISDICDGFYPINNDCAILLVRCFNVPVEFWLALEANYREWLSKPCEHGNDIEVNEDMLTSDGQPMHDLKCTRCGKCYLFEEWATK